MSMSTLNLDGKVSRLESGVRDQDIADTGHPPTTSAQHDDKVMDRISHVHHHVHFFGYYKIISWDRERSDI
jgi:hypothetical protein